VATGYITHNAQATRIYQYHFICEHCGKDSGLLSAAEVGYGSINTPAKRALSPEQSIELQNSAQASLDTAIEACKRRFDKGKYGGKLKGKCPYCGKRQSWELPGSKAKPWLNALYGTAAGLMLMIIAMLIDDKWGNYMAICVPLGFGLGLLIGYTMLAKKKVDSKRTSERNLPEVIW